MQAGPKEIANVFQIVRQHLELHPAHFEVEGIFRKSAEHDKINSLLEQIYAGSKPDLENCSVHECIGLLTVSLGSGSFLSSDNPLVSDFLQWFNTAKLKDTDLSNKAVRKLNEFVHALLTSLNLNDSFVAAIMLDFLYLIKQIHLRASINLMTSKNLAIILSPYILMNICSMQPEDMVIKRGVFNGIFERLIETDCFITLCSDENLLFSRMQMHQTMEDISLKREKLISSSEQMALNAEQHQQEKLKLQEEKRSLELAKKYLDLNKSKLSKEEYKRQSEKIVQNIKACDKGIVECSEAIETCKLLLQTADGKEEQYLRTVMQFERASSFIGYLYERSSSPSSSSSSSNLNLSRSGTPILEDDEMGDGAKLSSSSSPRFTPRPF